VSLIDREADLVSRGRDSKTMEGNVTNFKLKGLRKRIINLFLQFIQTPEFNPEAATFQSVFSDLTYNSFQMLATHGKETNLFTFAAVAQSICLQLIFIYLQQ
jgi:hypothetical protein